MRFLVSITRRKGLADPEGTTTERALRDLGYSEVADVRFGRTITIDVSSDDEGDARTRIVEMCERLLANPVIEDYRVERIE